MVKASGAQKRETVVIGLFTLIVVTIHIAIINGYAVNIPNYDDYNAVLNFLLRFQDTDSWRDKINLVYAQHNEHRIVTDKIFILLDYCVFGKVSFRHLIFLSNTFLLSILVLLFIGHRASRKSMYYFLPVPLILLNIGSGELLLWAMSSVQIIGTFALALWCIYFLFSSNAIAFEVRFWIALLLGLIATFSSGNGFLVLVICLVGLLIQRQKYVYSAIWLVITLLATMMYFKGYVTPEGHPDIFHTLASKPHLLISHFFVLLGNYFSIGTPFQLAIKIFSGFFIFSVILYYFWNAKLHKINPGYLYSTWFLVVTCMATSLSRSGFGVDQAQTSRYQLCSYLVVVFVYLSLIAVLDVKEKTYKASPWLFSGFSVLCIALYILNFRYYLPELKASGQLLKLGMVSYTDRTIPSLLGYTDQKEAREILMKSEASGIYDARWDISDVLNKDRGLSVPVPTNNVNSEYEIKMDGDVISIKGAWAFVIGQEYLNRRTYVVLKGKRNTYTFDTHMQVRHDVTLAVNHGDLDNCGFNFFIKKDVLEDDQYRVGLLISKYNELRPHYDFAYTGKDLVKEGNNISLLDHPSESQDYLGTFVSAESLYNIDACERNADTLTVRGWAFLKGIPSNKISVSLSLISANGESLEMETKDKFRQDISEVYHGSYNESGFVSALSVKGLPKGRHSLGITFSLLNVKRTIDAEKSIIIE